MTLSDRPWINLYPAHVDHDLHAFDGGPDTLAAAWRARVSADPESVAVRYSDISLSAERVDELTDALAGYFAERGVGRGERVGIQLQNIPQFALCLIALWKNGAVPLILNTMYGSGELNVILTDARPVGIVSSELDADALSALDIADPKPWLISTADEDVRPLTEGHAASRDSDAGGLVGELLRHLGHRSDSVDLSGNDPALLTYTSGTTGPPKGAVGTHANLLAVARGNQQWFDVRPGDGVLAVAPLFHITGAVATATMTLVASRATLVFVGRVSSESIVAACRSGGVHHILGSITVYNALLSSDEPTGDDFADLKTAYSGGAPVPPATVAKFE